MEAKILDASLNRRSDLYRYMSRNYSRISAVLNTVSRPSWVGLARYFEERGVLEIEDEKRAAERTRQTWWKVRKDRAAKPGPRRSTKPSSATALPTPPQMQVAKPESLAQDDADDRNFRTVRPRN